MHLFGTVDLVVLPRSLDERDEVPDRLPRRGARRELEKPGHVLELRHQLLDAHAGHVNAGKRCREADIALVLYERDRPGVRRQEVAAGDPQIGGEELGAERIPCRSRELVRFRVQRRTQTFVEESSAVVTLR